MTDDVRKIEAEDLPRCGSCHWYHRNPLNVEALGACFGLPPSCTQHITQRGSISLTNRPTVKPTDPGCGLHRWRKRIVEEHVTAKEEEGVEDEA